MGQAGSMDTERALAKLTLSLRVTGVRPDGYHLLDAEMVSLDLADTLTFSSASSSSGAASPGVAGTATGDLIVVGDEGARRDVASGEDNLVVRALRAVGRQATVTLHKRIAPGAGLGGGSSDAAAVLRWAGCRDLSIAVRLGADVPFCLEGGRARVTGIGEGLEALEFTAGEPYTLLTPPLAVSTAAVYRMWDDLGGPSGDGQNDLERAALVVEPELGRWRDRLGDATGMTPVLAGSGSTWWVPGAFADVPGALVTRTARPREG